MLDLKVQLAPLHRTGLMLANPVMTASGTFGYGIEYSRLIDVQRIGAIVCKGTTLRRRQGNLQPRLVETASGLLNSIGMQNVGVKDVVKRKAPVWAGWRVPVIVNIAGETIDEYKQVASMLQGVAGVSGIELNISCPNLACGGIEFGTDPKVAADVTAAVKAVSEQPVIVKLSPNVTDIVEIAVAVCEAGADAVTIINTVRGMAINVNEKRPSLSYVIGGLSGTAIKPIALYMVYKVAKAVDVPVIGCGGISSADDALEFIMAGASAIQVGTATFSNPRAALDILDGIERFMLERRIRKLSSIVRTVKV